MVESHATVTQPELYEKLIDRLGMALDAAKTAGRLRDERPLELELRGLSRAEFDLIKAYLNRSEHAVQGGLLQAEMHQETPRSAKVIWLKDKVAGGDAVKVRSRRAK